jgi:hypothetical protein
MFYKGTVFHGVCTADSRQKQINAMKKILKATSVRDFGLFTLGINSVRSQHKVIKEYLVEL